MRVAIISHGVVEYCIQQANGVARECDVLLMLPQAEAKEYKSLLDPAIEYYPFHKPRLRQPMRQIVTAAGMLRKIRRFRPDVVHIQQGHMWFNLALPILRRYPLVLTIHDPRYHLGDRDSQRTPQWLMDFGFRQADHVIVHGEALKRQVTELIGIGADKIHIIPHVATGNVNTRPDCHDDGRTVLFFGRIWEYKGLRYLIEAEPLISAQVPDARIVIGGAGEDFDQYRRMMKRPERFVVHNRFVSAEDRDEMFRQASVVVLPYIEATQSGVVPVAYSFGKPVVATDVRALSEAVDDGKTGRLVRPADAPALASAIVQLLKDSQLRLAMGRAGRRKLETEWSPKAVAEKSIDVYERAIRDRSGKRHSAAAARCEARCDGSAGITDPSYSFTSRI